MADFLSFLLSHPDCHPAKFAITGDVHTGKTTRAEEWIQTFRAHGIDCYGCLEKAVFDDGMRIGYDFEDISTGERRTFARRKTYLSESHACKYCFDETVWPWIKQIYSRSCAGSIIFFDELGVLESEGGGIMPIVGEYWRNGLNYLGFVCVCRANVLEKISRQLSNFDETEWISKET